VLEPLGDHIRLCNERAAEAELRAAQADEPQKSRELDRAKWWAHLARSYEFAESLQRFLTEVDARAEIQRNRENSQTSWHRVASAPYDRDLRLAVLDEEGDAHALVFPCRRVLNGWVRSDTRERLHILPTHWQDWSEES
jgi:hypothetical protein